MWRSRMHQSDASLCAIVDGEICGSCHGLRHGLLLAHCAFTLPERGRTVAMLQPKVALAALWLLESLQRKCHIPIAGLAFLQEQGSTARCRVLPAITIQAPTSCKRTQRGVTPRSVAKRAVAAKRVMHLKGKNILGLFVSLVILPSALIWLKMHKLACP